MAENKKGFILYADLIHTVSKLPNDKAGELLKHILSYVNDEKPQTDDLIIQLTFEPIKQQLKRDLKKYEDKKSKKSISGRLGNLKRWHYDLFVDYEASKITLDEAEEIASNRKVSHTDDLQSHPIANIAVNDKDNVTVKDTVNVIDIKKEKKEVFNFRKSLIDLGFDETLVVDWLKVRKTKKASNTQTAFSAIKNQVDFSDLNINQVLQMHVEKSWSGFKIKWYENELQKNKQNGQQVSNTKQAATYNRSKAINEIYTKFGGGN